MTVEKPHTSTVSDAISHTRNKTDHEQVDPLGDTGTAIFTHDDAESMLQDGSLVRNVRQGSDYNDPIQLL
ncbi:MAG: hypothetical protein ACXV39_12770 [Halobacteriota archaeon]